MHRKVVGCKLEHKTDKKVKREVKREAKKEERQVIKVDFDQIMNYDDISQEPSKQEVVTTAYHCLPHSNKRPSALIRQGKSKNSIRKKIKKASRVKMENSYLYELDEQQDKPTFIISNREPEGEQIQIENFELEMGQKKYLFASW